MGDRSSLVNGNPQLAAASAPSPKAVEAIAPPHRGSELIPLRDAPIEVQREAVAAYRLLLHATQRLEAFQGYSFNRVVIDEDYFDDGCFDDLTFEVQAVLTRWVRDGVSFPGERKPVPANASRRVSGRVKRGK